MTLYFSQYAGLFIYFVICCILAFVFFGISYIVATQNGDTEKLSAYECGFDPFDDARSTFDVRFYLVAILFIIFDLEAVYIFPWVLTLSSNFSLGFWTMIEFLIELVVGFIYVWCSDALEWD